MHLFNVKQLFFRRRKYERVLGGGLPADQQGLDLVLTSPSASRKHQFPSHNYTNQSKTISGQHYRLSGSPAQETSSTHAMSKGSSAPASSSSSSSSFSSSSNSTFWGFKMRPKLRMRKQKSLKLVSTSADGPQPSQAAVQNFLQGPSQDEEIYNQQCRDLLRKLSARGNRVPGFI